MHETFVISFDINPERHLIHINLSLPHFILNVLRAIETGLGVQLNSDATFGFCRVSLTPPTPSLPCTRSLLLDDGLEHDWTWNQHSRDKTEPRLGWDLPLFLFLLDVAVVEQTLRMLDWLHGGMCQSENMQSIRMFTRRNPTPVHFLRSLRLPP